MNNLKWSKNSDPTRFDSPTYKLVLDWSGRLDRIERMLKWLVVAIQTEFRFESMTDKEKERLEKIVKLCPDIGDILGEGE